jgi:hypothetical protein
MVTKADKFKLKTTFETDVVFHELCVTLHNIQKAHNLSLKKQHTSFLDTVIRKQKRLPTHSWVRKSGSPLTFASSDAKELQDLLDTEKKMVQWKKKGVKYVCQKMNMNNHFYLKCYNSDDRLVSEPSVIYPIPLNI